MISSDVGAAAWVDEKVGSDCAYQPGESTRNSLGEGLSVAGTRKEALVGAEAAWAVDELAVAILRTLVCSGLPVLRLLLPLKVRRLEWGGQKAP